MVSRQLNRPVDQPRKICPRTIDRRDVMLGLAMAAFLPAASAAERASRLGVLTPSERQWNRQAVLTALDEAGHGPGTALRVEVRSAEGDLGRLPALARELVDNQPSLILAINSPAAQAAIAATATIPIVAAAVADPVASGFAPSLARPGSNITGFANMTTDLTGKRLALLKEVLPECRRIAAFYHPDEVIVDLQMDDLERTAPTLGITVLRYPMRSERDVAPALEHAAADGAEAVLRLSGQALSLGAVTARLALARRLPAMLLSRADVVAGGLMSYYPSEDEQWRRTAALIDRLLRGARPDELPFERPTRFDLVVNVNTARTLGLSFPPSILLRADEVIE